MSTEEKDSKFSFIGTLIGAIAGSTSDFSGGRGRVNAQATQDIKNDAFERKLKQNQNASDRIIKDSKTDANKKIVELQKLSNENTNAISGQISKIDAKLNSTISRVSTIETGLGDLNRALKNLSKENGKGEFQKVTFADHEKRIKQLEKVNGVGGNITGALTAGAVGGWMARNFIKFMKSPLGKAGIVGALGYASFVAFQSHQKDATKKMAADWRKQQELDKKMIAQEKISNAAGRASAPTAGSGMGKDWFSGTIRNNPNAKLMPGEKQPAWAKGRNMSNSEMLRESRARAQARNRGESYGSSVPYGHDIEDFSDDERTDNRANPFSKRTYGSSESSIRNQINSARRASQSPMRVDDDGVQEHLDGYLRSGQKNPNRNPKKALIEAYELFQTRNKNHLTFNQFTQRMSKLDKTKTLLKDISSAVTKHGGFDTRPADAFRKRLYDTYKIGTQPKQAPDLSITDTNLPETDLSFRSGVGAANADEMWSSYLKGGWAEVDKHAKRLGVTIPKGDAASARKKWPGMSHLGSSVRNGSMPLSQSGTGLVKQRQQLTGMSAQQHQDYQEKKQFLKFGALPGGFEHVDGNRGILGKPWAVMAGGAQARGSGGGFGGGFGGGPGGYSGYSGGNGGTPISSSPGTVGATQSQDLMLMKSKDERAAYMYKMAIDQGFGPEQAKVVAAVAMHESANMSSPMFKRANNPIGMTIVPGQVRRGNSRSDMTGGTIVGGTVGSDGQQHGKYATVEDSLKHLKTHSIFGPVFRQAKEKGWNAGQIATALRNKGYNSQDRGWLNKVMSYTSNIGSEGFNKHLKRLNSASQPQSPAELAKSVGLQKGEYGIKKMPTNRYMGKDGDDITKKRLDLSNVTRVVAHDVGADDAVKAKIRADIKRGMTAQAAGYKHIPRDNTVNRAYHGYGDDQGVFMNSLETQRPHAYKLNPTSLSFSHRGIEGTKLDEAGVKRQAAGLQAQYTKLKAHQPNLTWDKFVNEYLITHHDAGADASRSSVNGVTGKHKDEASWLKQVKEFWQTDEGKKFRSGSVNTPTPTKSSASALLNAEDKIYQEQVNGKKDFITGNMAVARKQATGGSMADLIKRSSSTTGGSGVVNELQKDKASVRVHPISKKLKKALGYAAAKAGVEVDIWSGGQDEAGRRKLGSSKRHNHGNAADLDLYVTEGGKRRKLKSSNTKDRKLIASFIKHSAAAGAGGIGTGYGYMGDGRLHVGFGKQNTWGGGMNGDYAVAHKAGVELQGKVDINNTGVGKQTILNDKSLWAQNEMNQMRSANAPPGIGPGMMEDGDTISPKPEQKWAATPLNDRYNRLYAYGLEGLGPDLGRVQGELMQAEETNMENLNAPTPKSERGAILGMAETEMEVGKKEKETELMKKEADARAADAAGAPGSNRGGGAPERSFPKTGDAGVGGSSRCWV